MWYVTGLHHNFLSFVSLSFMTPLHVAAERAHNDILEVLQKHGAKVCCFVHFQSILPDVKWYSVKNVIYET